MPRFRVAGHTSCKQTVYVLDTQPTLSSGNEPRSPTSAAWLGEHRLWAFAE